jgi:hypothetical protein
MAVGGFPVINPYRHEESQAMNMNPTQHSVSTPGAGEKSTSAVELPVLPATTLTPAAPQVEAAPDPFDPALLRLSQDMLAAAGVKKMLTTVPVRKPSKEWYVRCHPDPAYRLETFVVELKEDGETYLVDPKLWPHLAGESTFSPKLLITTVNKQGTVFVWPIRLPSPDGRHDDRNKSALEASAYATKGWVRVQANMNLGAYEIFAAGGNLGDPNWGDLPGFKDVLKIAFKDRYIDTPDHPVLRRLRGES